MFRKTHVFVMAAALATLSAPAWSEPREAPLSARVSYADLDLHSEADVETLVTRIEAAARRVCPININLPIELQQRDAIRACREAVLGQAAARFNAPLVCARIAARLRARSYTSN